MPATSMSRSRRSASKGMVVCRVTSSMISLLKISSDPSVQRDQYAPAPRPANSLRCEPRGFDDPGPFLDIGAHKSAELCRTHDHGYRALLRPCRLHVRPSEHLVDFGIEFFADRIRQPGGADDAEPD